MPSETKAITGQCWETPQQPLPELLAALKAGPFKKPGAAELIESLLDDLGVHADSDSGGFVDGTDEPVPAPA